jgi:uncharacterized protein YlaI
MSAGPTAKIEKKVTGMQAEFLDDLSKICERLIKRPIVIPENCFPRVDIGTHDRATHIGQSSQVNSF